MWNLFIDDQCYEINKETGRPYRDCKKIDSSREYINAKNLDEVFVLIKQLGCPNYISFDHDLGENELTGYDLAKYIVERDLDENGKFIPDNFGFTVHSANPIGKKNIEYLLNNYLNQKKASI